jgi:hypothetical protein
MSNIRLRIEDANPTGAPDVFGLTVFSGAVSFGGRASENPHFKPLNAPVVPANAEMIQ